MKIKVPIQYPKETLVNQLNTVDQMNVDLVNVKLETWLVLFVIVSRLSFVCLFILKFFFVNYVFIKGVTGSSCNMLDTTGLACASNPCYGDSFCIDLAGNAICICEDG